MVAVRLRKINNLGAEVLRPSDQAVRLFGHLRAWPLAHHHGNFHFLAFAKHGKQRGAARFEQCDVRFHLPAVLDDGVVKFHEDVAHNQPRVCCGCAWRQAAYNHAM